MKYLLLLLSLCSLVACTDKEQRSVATSEKNTSSATPQDTNYVLEVVNFEQLKPILEKEDDSLYVVNFWATWCGPCVKELPEFMEVNAAYRQNNKFKMILVTLDKRADLDKRVKPFIKNRKIKTDVYLLDDVKKMNEWIPAIDDSWSGSLPATVFYKNGKKLDFKEQPLSKAALEQIINKHI